MNDFIKFKFINFPRISLVPFKICIKRNYLLKQSWVTVAVLCLLSPRPYRRGDKCCFCPSVSVCLSVRHVHSE